MPRKPRSNPSGPQAVRLLDIAQAVGVSMITVSRALSHPDKVSQPLRERIIATANEMGYVPNHSAQTLASSRSRTILVQVPSLSNAVFIDLLEGVSHVLQAAQYHMLICNTHYSGEGDWPQVRNYLRYKPDGLLFTGSHLPAMADTALQQLGIPVVFMMDTGQNQPGSTPSRTQAKRHCIGFSQSDAGASLTQHLLHKGHRRIAFVGAQLDERVLQRHHGYLQAMKAAGLPPLDVMDPQPSSPASGARWLSHIRENHPDCSAIFFCNDDLAIGALAHCHRSGWRVPHDIAIAGFNDLPGALWTVPALTTVCTPRRHIGQMAAQRLLSLLEQQTSEVTPAEHHMNLGFELKVRDST